MIECIHSHDHTRPVTCGTNLMVMGRAAKGQGIYQDGETNTTSSSKEQKKAITAWRLILWLRSSEAA